MCCAAGTFYTETSNLRFTVGHVSGYTVPVYRTRLVIVKCEMKCLHTIFLKISFARLQKNQLGGTWLILFFRVVEYRYLSKIVIIASSLVNISLESVFRRFLQKYTFYFVDFRLRKTFFFMEFCKCVKIYKKNNFEKII